MVRRGLVAGRQSARRLIVDRKVLVDGSFADKPARMVGTDQAITLVAPPPPFVSRAGLKLQGALDEFAIDPTDLVCLDAGSSTGGFTDCLLQRGARRVVAVDVGTNQLHERIRDDRRVVVREQTDIRLLRPDQFNRPFGLIVGDLSFISLRLVLPWLVPLLDPEGAMVLLIKPQFEAGRTEAARGQGVITDPAIWHRTMSEVLACAGNLGLQCRSVVPSAVPGTRGNVEFVAWLVRRTSGIADDLASIGLVDQAVDRAAGEADR